MKKATIPLILFLIIFPIVSAQIEIEKEPVVDVVVSELKNPAIFNLEITNLGESDIFNIYSLVGVDILPNESFSINSGETKKIQIKVIPQEPIFRYYGSFNFVYKIKGEKTGITEDVMTIKIMKLEDVLDINSYNINLKDDKAVVYVKNKIALPFNISAKFSSAFFEFSKNFSLNPYGKKEFEVSLDKEKIKKLVAGSYILTSELLISGVKEKIENSFKFSEKENIETKETKEGIIISKLIVEKINNGNLPIVARIEIKKDIISRLFTTFNVEPVKIEREGFAVIYYFEKELDPSESFTIKATTNWTLPFIILIFIFAIIFLFQKYTSTDVILKKKATYVKTKGGEFALKISLIVRAKRFVEKINVVDKIPSLVKVHERFGSFEPDKIDEKNRRLEWNIDSLDKDEERIFSYVIYSKVAPVGKFEIPSATAVYEREGKIREAKSNKVFFITEQKKEE